MIWARDLFGSTYRNDTDLVLLSCCHSSYSGKATCSLGQENPGFELGALHLGSIPVATVAGD